MSLTILPAKTDLPIVYMFTAICLNDIHERIFEFKKDVVYEFFRKGDESLPKNNQYYVKAYGTDIYQEIDFRLACFAYSVDEKNPEDTVELHRYCWSEKERSKFHFQVLGHPVESIVIPRYKKILGFFKWVQYKYFRPRVKKGVVRTDEYFFFNREIKAKVYAPIVLLKKQNEDIILEFSEHICYALASLEKFCEIPDVVDLKAEIDKVNELLKGYYSFALSANESFNEKKVKEMKEFLEKHHSLMNSLSSGIKQLTDRSNDK
ncbi:hypothetical protein P9D51_10860 [Bacillus sonorensis]|uniref:hypothetical protein n=1 Tax=Bacillus sonorensis TaxID=119858 RepID=UPI002DBE15A1|nr:hypothetical protein [Bacillus sonorensis]MEC1426605.1 hypothetical protein [Bacillus sonorensis]